MEELKEEIEESLCSSSTHLIGARGDLTQLSGFDESTSSPTGKYERMLSGESIGGKSYLRDSDS
jgi:hypothetical protein